MVEAEEQKMKARQDAAHEEEQEHEKSGKHKRKADTANEKTKKKE